MIPSRQSPAEVQVNALASRQHGVVSRAQLLESGLAPGLVDWWVRSGRLVVLHRGVYLHGALTGPLRPARSREMAAVLASGPDSVVSHESAGALWGLLRPERETAPVHVTTPGADRGRRPGIRPHRVAELPEEDRAVVDGVPVTTVPRTLVDLAGRLRPRAFEQALATADREGLTTRQQVAAVLERSPVRRGAVLIRRYLEDRDGPAFTRSVAEERFLTLVRQGRLPRPEVNAHLEGVEVDFLWRSEKVIVEVDGFAYHRSRRTFESDRRRDTRLMAKGFRVVRITWRRLKEEPHSVLVQLAQVLALARTGGGAPVR